MSLFADTDPRHGTRNLYNQGCRCVSCRTVHNTAMSQDRLRRGSQPIPENVPHGVVSTYTNYLCRCPLCKEAKSERNASERRRRAS